MVRLKDLSLQATAGLSMSCFIAIVNGSTSSGMVGNFTISTTGNYLESTSGNYLISTGV